MATTETQQQAPAPGLPASEPFVSAHRRAMVVIALFVTYIVLSFLSLGTTVFRIATDPVILAAAEEEGEEAITLADLLMLLVGLPAILVYIALVVAFLMWLYRVSKNVPALGNAKSRVEYSPGWAVGSFFIPFANFYMPYKAVREVWDKSDPAIKTEDDIMFTPSGSAPHLLGWWLTWLAATVLSRISWRLEGRSGRPDLQNFIAGVDIAADVLAILAAVLAIIVVRDIDRRQTERSRYVNYAPHTPPPPPLFTQQPQPPPQQQGA